MRKATVARETGETRIDLTLDLDGTGKAEIDSGLPFLDHMLDQLAAHGLFDLDLRADGDLEVDAHHTVEDCALTLGEAFHQALDERKGIVRMGSAWVPMDEALAFVGLDFSGRPYWSISVQWAEEQVGGFAASLIEHFLHSFAASARVTLHAKAEGRNSHHQAEAMFKALARALDAATQIDERRQGVVPSTKGAI